MPFSAQCIFDLPAQLVAEQTTFGINASGCVLQGDRKACVARALVLCALRRFKQGWLGQRVFGILYPAPCELPMPSADPLQSLQCRKFAPEIRQISSTARPQCVNSGLFAGSHAALQVKCDPTRQTPFRQAAVIGNLRSG